MCKVDGVIVMLSLHSEGERVVVTCSLTFHRVLIVADVTAGTNPTLTVSFGAYL